MKTSYQFGGNTAQHDTLTMTYLIDAVTRPDSMPVNMRRQYKIGNTIGMVANTSQSFIIIRRDGGEITTRERTALHNYFTGVLAALKFVQSGKK